MSAAHNQITRSRHPSLLLLSSMCGSLKALLSTHSWSALLCSSPRMCPSAAASPQGAGPPPHSQPRSKPKSRMWVAKRWLTGPKWTNFPGDHLLKRVFLDTGPKYYKITRNDPEKANTSPPWALRRPRRAAFWTLKKKQSFNAYTVLSIINQLCSLWWR